MGTCNSAGWTIGVGILLAMVIEIPIAFVYVWLSTALPRSGGDYVFQSRVFGGGLAFTVVMSGFVIWILQWVALSGWLVSYLGFAPLPGSGGYHAHCLPVQPGGMVHNFDGHHYRKHPQRPDCPRSAGHWF